MSAGEGRLERRFEALREAGRGGFVSYISAGDPDRETSLAILRGLPAAGADVIEIGVPFTDPMADGPAIQAANQRALRGGMTLRGTLEMVQEFRRQDNDTPIALMGYFNPIYRYGVEAFSRDAAAAGIDGLIVVDLPPEEDAELRVPALAAGLRVIRLTAPTSDDRRLPRILEGAGGFIYHVAITGITGTTSASADAVAAAVERLRRHTDLPLAVGFGIRTPEQAAEVARVADAAVVGSALVQRIADCLEHEKPEPEEIVESVLSLVRDLSGGVRSARA